MRDELEHGRSDGKRRTLEAYQAFEFSGGAGRDILARRRQNSLEAPSSDLLAKSKQLIHHRGASGLALACES